MTTNSKIQSRLKNLFKSEENLLGNFNDYGLTVHDLKMIP
jgi:hypothetical protein